MNWTDHAIWWHIYPLGFCGAPIRDGDHTPAHRIRRIENWLDYVIELGASGILLGPIFDSATHGYDTLDYFRIDPRLGDNADFDHLIAECKRRGLRVLLDGVFSHVSDQHPKLKQALIDGPGAPDAELFDIDWEADGGPAPRVFEGHGQLARLNHTSPKVEELVVNVMTHWLSRGIDGWRLDAAYSIDTDFLRRVNIKVKEQYPDAWILGEVIHGDYADFVARSGVDSVTQYELWKAIWSSIKDQNFFELDWALQRHGEFEATFRPNTFIGNHDVTRIASKVGRDGAIAALTVLMTVGGIPSIYAGDEQGFTGVKEDNVSGDDAVRPPFPDHPSELLALGEPVLRAHQALIAIRRQHPWLVAGTVSSISLENSNYQYRVSAPDNDDHLDVQIALRDGAAEGQPAATISVRGRDGQTLWHFDSANV